MCKCGNVQMNNVQMCKLGIEGIAQKRTGGTSVRRNRR